MKDPQGSKLGLAKRLEGGRKEGTVKLIVNYRLSSIFFLRRDARDFRSSFKKLLVIYSGFIAIMRYLE